MILSEEMGWYKNYWSFSLHSSLLRPRLALELYMRGCELLNGKRTWKHTSRTTYCTARHLEGKQ